LTYFFSTSASIESWKFLGVVAEEKLILFKSITALSNLSVYIKIVDVLAVPDPPTRRVFLRPGSILFGLLITGNYEILSIMYSVLVESEVGMRSYENWILFGGTHFSADQIYQLFVVQSKQ